VIAKTTALEENVMAIHRIRTALFIPVLLLFTMMAAYHSVQAVAVPPPPVAAQAHTLVTIHELSGTGTDGKTYLLYNSASGYVTTLNALGRIGSQVDGSTLQDGTYHTLYVRLADQYVRLKPNGQRENGRFSEHNKPTVVRVRGMILVKDGKSTALRMLDGTRHSRYPGDHRGKDDD
jgi:hypothetical protein